MVLFYLLLAGLGAWAQGLVPSQGVVVWVFLVVALVMWVVA